MNAGARRGAADSGVKGRAGILPAQAIAELAAAGGIRTARAFAADQIQPASLDLRLGDKAYRVRTSFLPGSGRTVQACVERLSLHAIDLRPGAV
ncbi:MAG: 2'-deoxycytidine 5'-triphosphate deaminase, partial [Hyphomicrobiales bacterium]